MAQFVKVTSIDDLHHLYPNLQIDHIDGIQCMLQDDQITQYTDGQGQQVIATIEQTGMQLSQNIGSPTRVTSQQQQIVVHQPTQYIIQQMDSNDHHTVHYIQQSHQPSKKDEVTENQLVEQYIGSVTTNASSENSPLQQYIVKSQNDSHFVSQIQPIIQQPVQIHHQPNFGIGSVVKANENLGKQYQAIHQSQIIQQQQFRPQKKVEQLSMNSVQQSQHVLIPQLTSTSSQTARILHQRPRSQQETETSSAPVLIFQKLEGPLFIRQPQNKNCFQGSNEKAVKTALQFKAKSYDSNLGHNEKNQEFILSPPQISQCAENEQKIDLLGTQNQANKFSIEKQQSGELKVAIVEQSSNSSAVDQGNKIKVSSAGLTRSPATKTKTIDQHTETISASDNHHLEKFNTNLQVQSQASASITSQPTLIHLQYQSTSQNQTSVDVRHLDNGARKTNKTQSLKRTQQVGTGMQNMQVQNSPPSMPNSEKGDLTKNLKFTCGVINSPRANCSPNEINQKMSPRQGAPQTAQSNSSNKETNLAVTENADEATMLVILLNGEKKRIKIPCSQQSILLGQILQQAGLSSSPSAISIEQNVEDSNNSEQIIVKTSTPSNHTSISKGPVVAQFIPNFIATPRNFFATIQQQRPRTPIPRLTQSSNLGIVRQRLQVSSPRLSNSMSPQQVITSTGLSSEVVSLHPQLHHNITPSSPPVKEELPRFVPGYMAICPFCGIQSVDFNKCVRCKRKLPENVKCQSICNSKKKKTEKAENEKIAGENKIEIEEKQLNSPSTEVKEKIFYQLHDKKKPKGPIRKKKISDEPTEILILSSDDEEEDHKLKKTDLNKDSLLVFSKEPIYLNSQASDIEMNNILKESSLSEDLMKNVQPGYFTTLQCRNIRIGSYKVQPKERVFVSSKGIKIVINSLKNENSVIIIPLNSILKILIHFGRQIPVIFIYPFPHVGAQIRSILGMDDKMGPYYDPTSTEEESHKRITLLLEKITEDNKITLHKIFESDKLDELSEKEANEILLRASPLENRNISANRSQENIRKIMVYPPPPEKGGITLNNQDYACLGEDQFLNDVIIDFYLKYLLLKVLSPEDRNRTHVFSTFFYKRLTTKPKTIRKNDPENDPTLSPAEKRHLRVKGWTKQVNLFEKDFIIVPINEHSHWFLAIICFPGLTGPVRFSDNKPIEVEETAPKKSTQTVQIGDTTITHIMKPDGSTISLEMDSGSDRDEAEGDQDDLHPSSDDEESETAEAESNSTTPPVQIPLLAPLSQNQCIKDPKLKIFKKKPFKEPIKQPCILIFDSLAGASRVRVVATLRDYLKIEYKKKMGQDRDFTKDTIKGAVPKVPQQNNFTDCGLYVLQYVESFFQDPLHDFKLPLKYLQEWFPEEVVSNKRQKLAQLIRTLMEEQGIKIEEIGLPILTFTSEANATNCIREEEDDEGEEEMNDESEEMLKNQINASDNDDEEDMDLEDEEMEEDEDDELEIGNIQERWIGGIENSNNQVKRSVEHINTHTLIKNCSLVDYEASESEEEDCLSSPQTSLSLSRDQASSPTETIEETEYSVAGTASMDNEKSVPLTELQDFESQISCTTIEKTYEFKNIGYEVASSDIKYKVIRNEEETSLEDTDLYSSVTMSSNCNEVVRTVESTHVPTSVILSKGFKSTIVGDVNKMLVKEKTISSSRKDEKESTEKSLFLFKNNLDSKLCIPKNCDKSEESKKVRSTFIPQKNNVAACKRTYQALKSIRIPKKAERNLKVPGKRQKVDET